MLDLVRLRVLAAVAELPVVRRILLATYGEPPDPPATAAFITALKRVTLV
jgi:hypothetical protein